MPLGIANGLVEDSSFTASSSNSQNAPFHARLRGHSAWSAHPSDVSPWVSVDVGEVVRLTGISVQGRRGSWVEFFDLAFSDDGINYQAEPNYQVRAMCTPFSYYVFHNYDPTARPVNVHGIHIHISPPSLPHSHGVLHFLYTPAKPLQSFHYIPGFTSTTLPLKGHYASIRNILHFLYTPTKRLNPSTTFTKVSLHVFNTQHSKLPKHSTLPLRSLTVLVSLGLILKANCKSARRPQRIHFNLHTPAKRVSKYTSTAGFSIGGTI